MPELAEVEFYRKCWDPGIGETVRKVDLHPKARIFREVDTGALRSGLRGSRFLSSHSHGKNLLFEFSGGHWLGGHLGMTGKIQTVAPGYRTGKHDHLLPRLNNCVLVFSDPRMFGRVRYERCEEGPPSWWQQLPPEILSKEFTRKRIGEVLTRRAKTPVKTLLLDQAVFPGIGNWMADEICWRIGLDPATPAGRLCNDQASTLWKATRQVCRQALRVIGDDWKTPPDSWLFNHRWKDGGHCPRRGCGAELERADLRGRTTCWCPRCQRSKK